MTGPEAPLSAQVWRTINDPYVGQMSFLRIYGGTLKADTEFSTSRRGRRSASALCTW
jgi:elongation factor G